MLNYSATLSVHVEDWLKELNCHKIYGFLCRTDFLLAFASLFPSINSPPGLTSSKTDIRERVKMYRSENQ